MAISVEHKIRSTLHWGPLTLSEKQNKTKNALASPNLRQVIGYNKMDVCK